MPRRSPPTHYEVLEISTSASADEIKQAYRQLVKRHHPDAQASPLDVAASAERIRQVNAAYEVLKHKDLRQEYDAHLKLQSPDRATRVQSSIDDLRGQRTATDEEVARRQWIKLVYTPLNRKINRILRSLAPQIRELSADPYDEVLIDEFATYVETCRKEFAKAETLFRTRPNPSTLAGVASRLYYCLNQLGDAIEELHYFPLNFDDRHLHTGQELFRIARGLRQEAADTLQSSERR